MNDHNIAYKMRNPCYDRNLPVFSRGVSIRPSDLIVANDDGVFVINPTNAEQYAKTAIGKQDAEVDMKRQIDSGTTLSSLSGSDKFFS